MDHVCGGSLKSERKVGGGYKVPYMRVSYIILCSEGVIRGLLCVIGYLGFDRQLGGTSLFFSLFIQCPIPLCELSSQYEAHKIHLLSHG